MTAWCEGGSGMDNRFDPERDEQECWTTERTTTSFELEEGSWPVARKRGRSFLGVTSTREYPGRLLTGAGAGPTLVARRETDDGRAGMQ